MTTILCWLIFLFLQIPIALKFGFRGFLIGCVLISAGTASRCILGIIIVLISLIGSIGSIIYTLAKLLS